MEETQRIWDEFGVALRVFIRRRVNDDHAADDLLQDVFVRIHDHLDSLADSDRLAAWIYRIARNAIVDHHRRRPHVGIDEREVAFIENEDRNINEQVGEWLSDFVEQLPDGYRQAVRLSELEGIPQTEVAQRLDLSISGAKSRVQRGRQMLRRMLLRCCHFEFDRAGNVTDYRRQSDCTDCGCDTSPTR